MGNRTTGIPRGFTGLLTFISLARGSTADELAIASTVGTGYDYAISGIMYHGDDDASTNGIPGALAVQADLTQCVYMLLADSAGTLSVIRGEEYLTTDIDSGAETLQQPDVPANRCPLGLIKVITAGGTFTAGTTNFGTNNTDTYTDVCGLPEQPSQIV